jgi:hypothetical protein
MKDTAATSAHRLGRLVLYGYEVGYLRVGPCRLWLADIYAMGRYMVGEALDAGVVYNGATATAYYRYGGAPVLVRSRNGGVSGLSWGWGRNTVTARTMPAYTARWGCVVTGWRSMRLWDCADSAADSLGVGITHYRELWDGEHRGGAAWAENPPVRVYSAECWRLDIATHDRGQQ